MSKKLSLEEIKNRLNSVNPNIEILSKEYLKDSVKLQCKCKIDGYEWKTTWSNLRRSASCPKCAKKSKLTIEMVKFKTKEINKNIEILSNEYINNYSKLTCRCLVDGCEWETNWQGLRDGHGCPVCSGNKKLSLIEIKKKLNIINPNISILSDNYVNCKSKLKCKCKICNYEWNVTWDGLNQGRGCPICGINKRTNNIKLTFEEVKEGLSHINPNIEIISNTYFNNLTKLKCRCIIDNNIWETNWGNLSSGHGCPKCARDKISGKNNYNYNPNLTDEERERNRKILYENIGTWRNNVYKRDNYTCQYCGRNKEVSGKLNSHHLNGYNWDKEHRVDVDNGVALCEECHKEFHLLYGYGYNTKEQYEEWIENKLLNITE